MGHTYKDARDHFDDKPINRYYRKMKHVKKQRQTTGLSRCGVTGKIGFPTMELAQKRADEIINEGARDGIIQFRIYHCPDCTLYHLTKTLNRV